MNPRPGNEKKREKKTERPSKLIKREEAWEIVSVIFMGHE